MSRRAGGGGGGGAGRDTENRTSFGSSVFGGGGGAGGGEFLSMSRFAAMSFDEARSNLHPTVREPTRMSLAAGGVGSSRRSINNRSSGPMSIHDMQFGSIHDMLTNVASAAVRAPGMRSRQHPGRPGTAGFDEYQALQMLDEDVVKRGVSDRKMRSLPEQPVKRQCVGKDKCDVCQFEYADTDRVITLPCKHFFHSGCIKEWFKENRTCPVCRYEVEA